MAALVGEAHGIKTYVEPLLLGGRLEEIFLAANYITIKPVRAAIHDGHPRRKDSFNR